MERHTRNGFCISFMMCTLFYFTLSHQANGAQYFIGPVKNPVVVGQTSFGLGYYDEPVVYSRKDIAGDEILSHYKGLFVKLTHNFDNSLAIHAQYLRARGEDLLSSYGASLVYGFNLGNPGPGIYGGVAYSWKTRTHLASERILKSEKKSGVEYPIGVQVRNGLYTWSIETRYKNLQLDNGEVDVKKSEYPVYFGVLMNF